VRGDTKHEASFNSRASQRTGPGLPTSESISTAPNTNGAGQAVGSTHSAQMQPQAQFMNNAMYPMGMGFPMNAPAPPFGYPNAYYPGPGIPGQAYGAPTGAQFAVQHETQNLDSRQSGGGGYSNKQTPMNQYDAQLHQTGQYMSHGLAHGAKTNSMQAPKPTAAASNGPDLAFRQGKTDDAMFQQQSNSFGYNTSLQAPAMQPHYGGAQYMQHAAFQRAQPQQFNTQQGAPFWTPNS